MSTDLTTTMNTAWITPERCRAARGALDWSQCDLADRSNLSESTIRDFEAGRRVPGGNNLAAIENALASSGNSVVQAIAGTPAYHAPTRRDWFAAHALTGYLLTMPSGGAWPATYDELAEKCFRAADAMMKGREGSSEESR